MNSYPEWWNQTVTIYSKFEDPTSHTISWYKTTVENCFWKNTDKVVIGDIAIETNTTLCRIPKDERFIEKYLWNTLDSEEKAKHLTIGPGDVIVRGEVEDTIDEYTKGSRSSDFIAKYKKLQGCMVVESIAINVGGGRDTEHYLAKGV